MQTLNVYRDGWRLVLPVVRGRKRVTAIELGTLRKTILTAEDLRAAKPVEIANRRLAAMIARKAKTCRRHGLRHPRSLIKRALEDLTE